MISQHLEVFSNEIGGNIKNVVKKLLYNKTHQHMEDLYNWVNQYF